LATATAATTTHSAALATRNGIMLISHFQHLMQAEGVTDFREAVVVVKRLEVA